MGSCSEVCVMKDYSVKKMFIIRETSSDLVQFACLNLKYYFKNGVILVLVNCTRSYLYDHKHKNFRKIVINDYEVFHSWDFLGSLVSPNNLGMQ
ncbi:hypothetical protein MKX01_028408 [Papaver californicum]|nr:hypothetical protein MKX01_028408 [Papaver californicum]